MKKIALLFGTFNPIHIGHLLILNYISQFTEVNEVGLVISPQNPFKQKSNIVNDVHRINMCQLALDELRYPTKLYDIEFTMPRPSYTIDTLRKLNNNYADVEFTLVMGADNLANIHLWRLSDQVLKYPIMVYPRTGYDYLQLANQYKVQAIKAPQIDISSTFIREAISSGLNVQSYLPSPVDKYITKHNLYQ